MDRIKLEHNIRVHITNSRKESGITPAVLGGLMVDTLDYIQDLHNNGPTGTQGDLGTQGYKGTQGYRGT